MQTTVAALNIEQRSTGSQCNFLRAGIILMYLLVFDTILAALFWIHCNLRRLNLDMEETKKRKKSESNHMCKFLTDSAGRRVLLGFHLSLLVDIHSFTSSRHLFNCSKAVAVFFRDKCT